MQPIIILLLYIIAISSYLSEKVLKLIYSLLIEGGSSYKGIFYKLSNITGHNFMRIP